MQLILFLVIFRNMLLVECSTISIYNYQGRLVASPRWPNMRLEHLRNSHISLSGDTLAVRDATDTKSNNVKCGEMHISNNKTYF